MQKVVKKEEAKSYELTQEHILIIIEMCDLSLKHGGVASYKKAKKIFQALDIKFDK